MLMNISFCVLQFRFIHLSYKTIGSIVLIIMWTLEPPIPCVTLWNAITIQTAGFPTWRVGWISKWLDFLLFFSNEPANNHKRQAPEGSWAGWSSTWHAPGPTVDDFWIASVAKMADTPRVKKCFKASDFLRSNHIPDIPETKRIAWAKSCKQGRQMDQRCQGGVIKKLDCVLHCCYSFLIVAMLCCCICMCMCCCCWCCCWCCGAACRKEQSSIGWCQLGI